MKLSSNSALSQKFEDLDLVDYVSDQVPAPVLVCELVIHVCDTVILCIIQLSLCVKLSVISLLMDQI